VSHTAPNKSDQSGGESMAVRRTGLHIDIYDDTSGLKRAPGRLAVIAAGRSCGSTEYDGA
jgi:hypothetical protein